MSQTERNACREAFEALCNEVRSDGSADVAELNYWLFERGYRAAVQELMTIAETGVQTEKFVSPKLQNLADRLVGATDCV
ncbi:MAG: hypothetical protein HOO90_10325 [Methylotenera sp.]|uniref:hypothetical protein n=1 Tax=Methylotenera sp. TaxID=2051956 RepID=UPI001823D28F|nr:hypothetical protein [Methylotenera sp.]NOU25912.1 hypothetical protein [Methylotenera sp.]